MALYNIALIFAEVHLSFPDDQYVHEYNYRVSFCFAIIGDVKIEPSHISAILYLRDGTGTYNKQVQSLDLSTYFLAERSSDYNYLAGGIGLTDRRRRHCSQRTLINDKRLEFDEHFLGYLNIRTPRVRIAKNTFKVTILDDDCECERVTIKVIIKTDMQV